MSLPFEKIEETHSLFEIKKELAHKLESPLPLKQTEILPLLERPKRSEHGHLALPVFSHSKKYQTSPKILAEKWAEEIKLKDLKIVEKTQPLSGFINFTFHGDFLKDRLESLMKKKELALFTGSSHSHWVMDFASPNVAKHINIGHLRAAVLGQALVNLARRFGCRITALNHLGDWGTQFGKLIWAYQQWGKEYDPGALDSLVTLYTRFHEEAEKDPEKNREAAALFKKLETGDPKLTKLWKNFVQISLKDYDRYWEMLNIKHDLVLGESFYRDLTEDVQKRLQAKNLLKESEGAQVVFLKENRPPCLIQKSDGASTYAARDLASAIYRFEKLQADKNIYITASEQKLHFQQIFQTLEKLNPQWGSSCKHIAFGMYRFKGGGKMSSRKGQAVFLKDVLEQARQRVKQIIESRPSELENKDQITRQVSIGALVFNDLQQDCVKDVEFNWDRVLDFEGRTGPFVQYTHVRCLSLIEKYNQPVKNNFSENFSFEEDEKNLAWHLLCFEWAVFQSFQLFKPHILANYLLDLSGEFNRFYATHRILDSDRTDDRMILVNSVRRVLNTGLQILNVPLPKKM